jgi:hypothetical protein
MSIHEPLERFFCSHGDAGRNRNANGSWATVKRNGRQE